jgi:hypothetical protein
MIRFRIKAPWQLVALAAMPGLAGTALAQDKAPVPAAQVHSQYKARLVKMTIHPAELPVPALKYHLLPEVRELKPGNAALLYQRAHSLEWWGQFIRTGETDKMHTLLEAPITTMPKDKVVLLQGPLREMELAARREYCDWELTPRLREDGFFLLIPDVQGFRTFGVMLGLQARVQMLDGHFDKAVNTMQTGFALSRHVGDAPILINSLVGMAIGQLTASRVEEFVQFEKAPNLYWALADLPRPFIDCRRAFQGEKIGFDGMFSEVIAALKDPNQPPLSLYTLHKYIDNLRNAGAFAENEVPGMKLMIPWIAARAYPAARKYLLAHGFSEAQVEALPVTQVSLMYGLVLFEEIYDETYKWESFPYWEAQAGLAEARRHLYRMFEEQPEASGLAKLIFPALDKIMSARARMDRSLNLLQTVEALRLAAAKIGKLPARLADIKAVPIPVDPITGKHFEYTLQNDEHAVLYGPPPAGEFAHEGNAVRVEITLAPLTKK